MFLGAQKNHLIKMVLFSTHKDLMLWFQYPQLMLWLRNKIIFFNYSLTWRSDTMPLKAVNLFV